MWLRILLNRLILAAVTLAGVAVIVFVLVRVVPGDPVAMMIAPGASEADILALRARYGLDLPLFQQFLVWAKGILTGDFGTSFSLRQDVVGCIGFSHYHRRGTAISSDFNPTSAIFKCSNISESLI